MAKLILLAIVLVQLICLILCQEAVTGPTPASPSPSNEATEEKNETIANTTPIPPPVQTTINVPVVPQTGNQPSQNATKKSGKNGASTNIFASSAVLVSTASFLILSAIL